MRSKIVAIEYKCLYCGNLQGTPSGKGRENWYWRYLTHGIIGPFCTPECGGSMLSSTAPKVDPEPRYTLDEWEKLYFLRWRVDNGLTNLPIIGKQD